MREVKPTQKPVPSSDVKDLFFNSGLLDIWATSLERKYIDRFGNCHLTAAGMEWIFNELATKFKIESEQALLAAGYAPAGTFQEGAEVVSRNGTVLWKLPDGDGDHYRWDGDLPKQVPAGSTPQSTGGIGKGAWVSVGDAALRPDVELLKKYSFFDVRKFGAVGCAFNEVGLDIIDSSDAIIECIDKLGTAYIPPNMAFYFDKTITLNAENLIIDGDLRYTSDGVGIHLIKDSTLDTRKGCITRYADSFDNDISCLVLLNNYIEGDGGCTGNTVLGLDLRNKFTPSSYPSVTPTDKCTGTGIWLLAGSERYSGLKTARALERVTRNNITIKSIRGFEYGEKKEARFLYESSFGGVKGQGGWVNSNTINSPFFSECKYHIAILCDGVHEGKTRGECSGNFFNSVSFQFDKGRVTERFIYCEGYNNSFTIMPWDFSLDDKPLFEFGKNAQSTRFAEKNFLLSLYDSGTREGFSQFNGVVLEGNPGSNTIQASGTNWNNSFVRVPPASFSYRQNQGYIGIVENCLANANKSELIETVQLTRINSDGELMPFVGNLTNAFTPDYNYVAIDIRNIVTLKLEINFKNTLGIDVVGIVFGAYKSGVVRNVKVLSYNSQDVVISELLNSSNVNAITHFSEINISNGTKKLVYEITVDNSASESFGIVNVFARSYTARNDEYHLRKSGDSILGDLTFEDGGVVLKDDGGNKFRLLIKDSKLDVVKI
ncbi:hypothetical protein M0K77_000352 [Providencia rettgeri]|uniref:Tail spike TSP1/Gp66 N-terminal domain-containing protein n=1 Tax=Providencia rettgeri TaxID=587 RepID=A0AAD2ZIN6_PRORE|nr:hypothetical protein [Providencia rettgeri]